MSRLIPTLIASIVLAACTNDTPAPEANAGSAQASEHHEEHEGHDHGTAEEEGEAGHDHDHGGEGEPDFARIDPARAGELGISIATASAGSIDEAVTLTGRLVIDPRKVAPVRARFAGPVVAVRREIGESVARGDTLALVESNESLTTYPILAPLAGVVLARNTNVGDVAGVDPLFIVGDVRALQAELQAFTANELAMRVGDAARVTIGKREVDGRIASIAPELEARTQARRIRVALAGEALEGAVPGQFVSGRVAVGSRAAVPVAVPGDAIRTLEGREVIFIPEEEGFRARRVVVARRGIRFVEVTEGLDAGEQYVSSGAFILKAEIGKNLAEHEH